MYAGILGTSRRDEGEGTGVGIVDVGTTVGLGGLLRWDMIVEWK